MPKVLIKRGTRAQIEAAKTANALLSGEPYLITDENRLAVGTGTNSYADAAKKDELTAAQVGAYSALQSDARYLKTVGGTLSGDLTTTAWYRSTGAAGWFNDTYGGGINMADTTFIRTYNGKGFRIDKAFDNVYGNLHLSSTIPAITFWDSDNATKAMLYQNAGNFQFVNATTGTENANDWVTRFMVRADGYLFSSALVGTGNRAVYSDPNGYLINVPSDRRLKKNIAPLPYGLASVLRLVPVAFNWTDEKNRGSQREIGLIAQDVRDVIGEVVGANADGTLSLDYPKLVAVLVNAIKDLKREIDNVRLQRS